MSSDHRDAPPSLRFSLVVPEDYRDVLRRLAELDETKIVALEDGFDAEYSNEASLAERAQRAVDGAQIDHEMLVRALLEFRGQFRRLPADEVALAISRSRELGLDADAGAKLSGRLHRLFLTRAISTTGKALAILKEVDRNVSGARIISEVRPFFDDPGKEVRAAAIVHSLTLETWESAGTTESITVTLESRDLETLQGEINRAKDKTAALREFLERGGLKEFEWDPGA